MRRFCFLPPAFSFSATVLLASMGFTILATTGCTTVSVGKRSTTQGIMAQRVNVLSGERLSHDTQSRLLQAGLDASKCLDNMPVCLVSLKNASLSQDKGLYAAYSELFYSSAMARSQGKNCTVAPKVLSSDYAKALVNTAAASVPAAVTVAPVDSKNTPISCNVAYQDDMLQAARFAYIYLMYDLLRKSNTATDDSLIAAPISQPTLPKPTTYSLANERDIQVQDLYYAAIDGLGDTLYETHLQSDYHVNKNAIQVRYNQAPIDPNKDAAKLVSGYQINLTGLNSISRRDGFGLNYVAILDDRYTLSIRNQLLRRSQGDKGLTERIHALGHLPVTAILLPKGDSLDSLLTTNQFELAIFDPYQYKTTQILGKEFALSANFSAAYGLWLNENALSPISIFTMLGVSEQGTQPQLFMLEPYNPNKRVIIMMHGLASSPETWIRLTNDIFNDPALRDNYQVWQVFYPTNMPILENRYQIHELINAAFHQVDTKGEHPASQHAVIIGHSMGGLIGRLLLSNDDLTPSLTQMLSTYDKGVNLSQNRRQFYQMATNKELANRFKMSALPEVDRAVFISSPFRGTNYADKWFTRGLRRIISLPSGFVKTMSSNLNSLFSEGQLADHPLSGLFLENGASQLSDKSFFMQLTKDVTMANNVAVHTIIATADKDLYTAFNDPNTATASMAVRADGMTAQPATSGVASAVASTYNSKSLAQAAKQLDDKQKLLEKVSENASDRVSDGIVPYTSAHLDGVRSEKLLAGNHSVQTSPQAVLELRRILHEHLQETGMPR